MSWISYPTHKNKVKENKILIQKTANHYFRSTDFIEEKYQRMQCLGKFNKKDKSDFW